MTFAKTMEDYYYYGIIPSPPKSLTKYTKIRHFLSKAFLKDVGRSITSKLWLETYWSLYTQLQLWAEKSRSCNSRLSKKCSMDLNECISRLFFIRTIFYKNAEPQNFWNLKNILKAQNYAQLFHQKKSSLFFIHSYSILTNRS